MWLICNLMKSSNAFLYARFKELKYLNLIFKKDIINKQVVQ